MLERLSGNEYYCFLDGFSGYFQILMAPEDQEKTTSLVLMGHLLIGECPSDYVMLPPHSNTLGWHLEEIHVTWAYLEKKWTRLRLYTKNHEELCIQHVETALPSNSDGVRIFTMTASEIQRRRQDVADLKRI
ncbi:hypothetical protein Tco_1198024 [Tanacetum coccineum]